jgi:hypothetical protein
MTEADWLTCMDPQPMLEHLHGRVTDRKARLYFCAWARTKWPRMADVQSRDAVVTAERFADGLVALPELLVAFNSAPSFSGTCEDQGPTSGAATRSTRFWARGKAVRASSWPARPRAALEAATALPFWVPRDPAALPGFTTNVEFGPVRLRPARRGAAHPLPQAHRKAARELPGTGETGGGRSGLIGEKGRTAMDPSQRLPPGLRAPERRRQLLCS